MQAQSDDLEELRQRLRLIHIAQLKNPALNDVDAPPSIPELPGCLSAGAISFCFLSLKRR